MNVQCPRCFNGMAVADQHLGMTVACPSCGQQVVTPAPQGWAPQQSVPAAEPADALSQLASASTSAAYRPTYATGKRPQPFNPGVAAVLSLVIPGAGQMYKGNVGGGLLWLFAVSIGYVLFIIPGVILHIICIFHAASGSR